jgi:hypothetical protein
MPRKDETALRRAEVVDLTRTIVRYKHRTNQRRELNEVEANVLEQFDARVQAGGLPQVKDAVSAIITGALTGGDDVGSA